MNAPAAGPQASTLFWTALVTLPLLMPGARRRYGTIPVLLGVLGLARQVYDWVQARRQVPTPVLRAAMRNPDITRSPRLHTHVE